MSNKRVSWCIRVRRFRCQNKNCVRSLFAERLAEIPVSAQRTVRFTEALRTIGFALGGESGQRVARQLKFPTSGDTLLRVIRRYPVTDGAAPAKVIGVADWAYRRGRVYGTLLVDLEQHQVIDLLPTRTAETLAKWLQQHPSIQIVARDRSGEYKRGIMLGVPQAQQIADRWHLLANLRESLERFGMCQPFDSVANPHNTGIIGIKLAQRRVCHVTQIQQTIRDPSRDYTCG